MAGIGDSLALGHRGERGDSRIRAIELICGSSEAVTAPRHYEKSYFGDSIPAPIPAKSASNHRMSRSGAYGKARAWITSAESHAIGSPLFCHGIVI
jgi:hypothetical protein